MSNKNYCWIMEKRKILIRTNLFKLLMELLVDKKKLENFQKNMKKDYR